MGFVASSQKKKKAKSTISAANPNFCSDAARIYISQLTDIDTNFGIAAGKAGNQKGCSGIGIKADAVRVIGRRGVKIMTGPSYAFKGAGQQGETDAQGRPLPVCPPIELIAGNTEEVQEFIIDPKTQEKKTIPMLQGVAKGEMLTFCLEELSEILEGLISDVFNLTIQQAAYNAQNGVEMPSPSAFKAWMPAGTVIDNLKKIEDVISSAYNGKINLSLWKENFLSDKGRPYIVSTNVFTT